ncbi:MAG TPA: crossover junction endodeoxyribonuclease RuvC [Armatimonadota bacterium]|nr:crossover junction endodeoxyribonuclease RuvC [Armatimonadota bacterium]
MRIIGIDPGLINTGYGVLEIAEHYRLECLAAGVIHPTSTELSIRLLQIHQQLTEVLHEFIPDTMAMEDLFTTYAHPKTAILMGHARGVIYLAASQRGIPVTNYAPTEVKRAVTSHGRASKEQVQSMVQRLLQLPSLPTPDHVSDALSLAICHAYRERVPMIKR